MRADKRNEEIEIDLGELFGVLLHYIWIIIVSTVVLAAIGFAVSKFVMTPQYKSTTGIYIMAKQNNASSVTYSDTQLATQLTKDYEELIVCRTVLETVIEECGLNDSYASLKDRVSVVNSNNTRIIYISVTDPKPENAQMIANRIREVASVHITAVTDTEAVTVVDEANLPQTPSEPSVKKWTMLAAAVGMVLSAGFIIVRYLLDDTIKSAEDVENYLGLSTLALIPVMEIIDDDGNKLKKKNVKKANAQATPSAANPVPGKNAGGTSQKPRSVAEVRRTTPVRRQDAVVDEIEIADYK